MLRPIRTITRTARRISSTNLHERLDLEGPEDELKELGDTLDDLFGRLDAAFEAQRHFVANASHELRTPLTVERTLLQVALEDPAKTAASWRSTAEEVLAYSDEQTRLIEALLALASSESGMSGHSDLDLADVVAATIAKIRPEADRSGVRIDEALSPAPLEGDALLVERLVVNLLTRGSQRRGWSCRGRDGRERGYVHAVGQQHWSGDRRERDRPSLPALPEARSPPSELQGRARARALHRASHRYRPPREHQCTSSNRRRSLDNGRVCTTRDHAP